MGLVHIYCGDGKGKTTASVGLAVRAAGSGMKVIFTQFFKTGVSSEINSMRKLGNIECVVMEGAFGRISRMTEEQKAAAKEAFNAHFDKVAELAKDYDMVIFDEINSAVNHGMVDLEKVQNFIRENRDTHEIVLTGRNPAEGLIELADYVSEIRKVKHPFDKGIKARKGVEF